jgi:hypothetical protein
MKFSYAFYRSAQAAHAVPLQSMNALAANIIYASLHGVTFWCFLFFKPNELVDVDVQREIAVRDSK